jgi:hypothetical protein
MNFRQVRMRCTRWRIWLLTLGLPACDGPARTDLPATIEVVSEQPADGRVGELMDGAVRVRVLASGGQPVTGVLVRFDASDGGSAAPSLVPTDLHGIAEATWRLGFVAGEQRLRVSLADDASIVTELTATALTGPAARITLAPALLSLVTGGQSPVAATAVDVFGNVIAHPPVVWTSQNEAVAVVDANGVVRAVGEGATLIVASLDGAVSHVFVHVARPAPIPGVAVIITLEHDTLGLIEGASTRLTATARDGYGTVITGRPIEWTSENPEVATVDEDGVVRAIRMGETRIRARLDDAVAWMVIRVARIGGP